MFVNEILDLARLRLDDVIKDAKGNYLWSDTELLVYFNEAEHELARKTRCLYDASTVAVCQYDVFPGFPTLSIDKRIVEINAAYFSTFYRHLFIKPVRYFDSYMGSNWRGTQEQPAFVIPNYEPHKIRFYPYYPTTYKNLSYQVTGLGVAGDIFLDSSNDTINRASGGLLTIFPVGTKLLIVNTSDDDGVYTVDSGSTQTSLVLEEALISTQDNVVGPITKKIDTLNLEVARLPLVNVAIADIATATPEVDEDYHLSLIDGILSRAYLKRDSETYNIQEATRYRAIWDSFIQDVRGDQIVIGEDDAILSPAYGAI